MNMRTLARHRKKIDRRKIRFQVDRSCQTLETAITEVQVIIHARCGWSTEAIANKLGLTKGQVNYRIKQGFATGARAEFRNGDNWIAHAALAATAKEIIQEVSKNVSTRYL